MLGLVKIVIIWFCPSTSISVCQYVNVYYVRKTGNIEVAHCSIEFTSERSHCYPSHALQCLSCYFMISAFLGSPQKGKFFLTKFQWEHETVIRFPAVGSILNEAVPHKQNKISAKAMFCLHIFAHLNHCSARLSQIIKFNLKFQWPNFIEQNSTTAATKQTPADLLKFDVIVAIKGVSATFFWIYSFFILLFELSNDRNHHRFRKTVENWSLYTEPMLEKFTKGMFEFL